VRKVLQLMWPAVLSGSVVQFNVVLNSVFASYLTEKNGPVTWLNNSFRLVQLPLGLFGVAVATITLPAMSRLATEGITEGFKSTLARGLKLVFLMTLPSAVGMAILAEPIISLIFQRGNYTAQDTAMTALALRTYTWGLIFYAGIKVVQPAFYAIDRRYIPLLVSLAAVCVSVVSNYLTVSRWKLGHDYLALGTSLSAIVNFSLLMLAMRKIAGGIQGRELMTNFIKLLISCAGMALVCFAAKATILKDFGDQKLLMKLATLMPTIAVAVAVYFGINILLKNDEVQDIRAVFLKKFGGKK